MKKMKNVVAIMVTLMIVFLSNCKKDEDPGIRPTVISTSPANNATNIATNSSVTAVFSVPMNAATITAAEFTLMKGTTAVPGVVSYSGTTAAFTPTGDLEGNTMYTGTITTGAKNMANDALLANHTFSFTTGVATDLTLPLVSSTDPANNATDVATSKTVTATFSEAMDSSSLTRSTFTLKQGTTKVSGKVTYSGMTASFNPTSALKANRVYTATITTGVKDWAENKLATDMTWSFTTGDAPDLTRPIALSIDPAGNEKGVSLDKTVTITFNEAMDASTINTSSFSLMQGTTAIAGTVSYTGNTAGFNPDADLEPNKVYKATVSTSVKDSVGNSLAVNKVWSFTTGAAPDVTAPVVNATDPTSIAIGVALTKTLSATFSEAMTASTINSSSFTLMKGTTAVPGSVTYSGLRAFFNPTASLEENTVYTATITTDAKDLSGNALATSTVWSFTTIDVLDVVLPVVNVTDPATNATGIEIGKTIQVTFGEAMDASTITSSTITLMQGTTIVPTTVTYSGMIATIDPTADLEGNKVYTVTVTTAVKDLAGNALAANKVTTFTTVAVADVTAPLVSSTNPTGSEIGVDLNKTIAITFSEAMDPLTITSTTFTLKQGTTSIPGVVTYVGMSGSFNPNADLEASKVYTATVSTSAKDLAGNALVADEVWSFTTGASSDVTLPSVNSTDPASDATGVAINKTIAVTFSEVMDPLSITSSTFTLKQGTTSINGAVTYSGTTGSFNPTNDLEGNKVYTATITTSAKDLAGNALAVDKVWSFTTVATAPIIAPVNLGTAGNFVILAKTAISTVPTSAITGDLGISPAATSFMTGFALTNATGFATAAQVTGKLYGADMAAPTPSNLTTAVSNMEAAYVDAAGRPTPNFLELGTGNIGGMTLTGGLYKWAGTVTVPSSITISGSANDVWIFQIAGDLTVSNSVNVTLTGGALAKNVFWQVAGTVSIGTTSHFEGVILSKTGITLKTGASLKGRALAQTAVILDANTVTGPGN